MLPWSGSLNLLRCFMIVSQIGLYHRQIDCFDYVLGMRLTLWVSPASTSPERTICVSLDKLLGALFQHSNKPARKQFLVSPL